MKDVPLFVVTGALVVAEELAGGALAAGAVATVGAATEGASGCATPGGVGVIVCVVSV